MSLTMTENGRVASASGQVPTELVALKERIPDQPPAVRARARAVDR